MIVIEPTFLVKRTSSLRRCQFQQGQDEVRLLAVFEVWVQLEEGDTKRELVQVLQRPSSVYCSTAAAYPQLVKKPVKSFLHPLKQVLG